VLERFEPDLEATLGAERVAALRAEGARRGSAIVPPVVTAGAGE